MTTFKCDSRVAISSRSVGPSRAILSGQPIAMLQLVKIHTSLLLAMLVHVAACSAASVAPVDSASDQTNPAADLHPESVLVDRPVDQATQTCLEFPGCLKLLYDQNGCPIECDVDRPTADAAPSDQVPDAPSDGVTDFADGGCDAHEPRCSSA